MDTLPRHFIYQNSTKFTETAVVLDIYTQDYSGYFKDINGYIYLNGKKYIPQDI